MACLMTSIFGISLPEGRSLSLKGAGIRIIVRDNAGEHTSPSFFYPVKIYLILRCLRCLVVHGQRALAFYKRAGGYKCLVTLMS